MIDASARSKFLVVAAASAIAVAALALRAQDSDFPKIRTGRIEPGEVHVLPVQGNVYMLSGDGGNTTVQIGKDGVLLVDTQFVNAADSIMAVIHKLNRGPIRLIINTSMDGAHWGSNAEAVENDSAGPDAGTACDPSRMRMF